MGDDAKRLVIALCCLIRRLLWQMAILGRVDALDLLIYFDTLHATDRLVPRLVPVHLLSATNHPSTRAG